MEVEDAEEAEEEVVGPPGDGSWPPPPAAMAIGPEEGSVVPDGTTKLVVRLAGGGRMAEAESPLLGKKPKPGPLVAWWKLTLSPKLADGPAAAVVANAAVPGNLLR